MREALSSLWVLIHLLYLTAEDLKEQRISMMVILELCGSGMLCAVQAGRAPSLLPGCLILLTGFFSRERIGYGDGWLMLALGMWMNTAELLRLFSGGVMLGFLYSLGCRKRDIPLVPFLTAAYVMEKWI